MGFKLDFSLSFLFAFALGYILIFHVIHFKINSKESKQNLVEVYGNSVSEKLFNEVKILCWIFTNPKTHRIKAKILNRTWGKRCNKFLFLSAKTDAVNGTVAIPVDDRTNLWKKTKNIYKHASD